MMALQAPFNRTAIETAIVAWLKRATDLTVQRGDQRIPQATHAYATYRMDTIGEIGHDEIRISAIDPAPGSPVDTTQTVCGLRTLVVSVNVFSSANKSDLDARALADLAFASLSVPSYADALSNAGIAISERGAVRSLDRVESTDWISRAQFDVTICVASNVTENVESAGTVEMTWTGEEPKWNPATQTFDVDS
jgi:hypothetical protein